MISSGAEPSPRQPISFPANRRPDPDSERWLSSAIPPESRPVGRSTQSASSIGCDKDPYYVRVPAGTLFYLYVTQTVDIRKATAGLSVATSTIPTK